MDAPVNSHLLPAENIDGIPRPDHLLSPFEIERIFSQKPVVPVFAPKKNLLSRTGEDTEYLAQKYREMEQMLGHERIVKQGRVSIGEFQDTRVLITQKVGKWDNFGFMDKGSCYLALHEALFMLEMKRLIIFRNKVTMTLEECYGLCLASAAEANECKLTLDGYQVYAVVMRNGFSVRRHNPNLTPLRRMTAEESCIWSRLDELLGRAGSTNSSFSLYTEVGNTMNRIRAEITGQSLPKLDDDIVEFSWPSTLKRKATPDASTSDSKRYRPSPAESVLDILKDEPAFKRFENIFDKFNTVKVKAFKIGAYETKFKFLFDIFNPKTNKREKKATVPNYRALVCKKGDLSPTRNDLICLQQNELHQCPILVFYVDDSMLINCFQYNFY